MAVADMGGGAGGGVRNITNKDSNKTTNGPYGDSQPMENRAFYREIGNEFIKRTTGDQYSLRTKRTEKQG